MIPTTDLEQESRQHYQKAMALLGDYKQKAYNVTVKFGGEREYRGIEVFASALSIEEKAQHIRDLLAGMGYSVQTDKNSETITIK